MGLELHRPLQRITGPQARKERTHEKQLKDLKRGETFYGAGIQWTVLDHSRSSQGLPLRTFVVSTDITENRAFDEGNKCDFAASTLRAYLNGEFLRKLEDELGAGNICEYVIDLTADDGLPKYGKDSVKVGLLTMEDYRRHRDILPPIGNGCGQPPHTVDLTTTIPSCATCTRTGAATTSTRATATAACARLCI